ncbi:sigma-70 family RNA polymerase sigma factor [Chryseolinea sp. T2]|uniref:RNA polymerase sigma factor n=1 Tax=Chryseolinea sp. T2 TaxID=3129255 RepID=UPI003076C5CE
MLDNQVNQLIGHLFRHEAGKMAAVLTRLLGFQSLDLAEDIVQDTLLKAMSAWKFKGIPDNPSAWLYTVAKRKAIDAIRKHRLQAQHSEYIHEALRSEWTLTPTLDSSFLQNEIEDSQLRMIFACCHPAIPYESQIALTLKTLCGLSILEIANCFLTSQDVITKRLYRAREKIRDEKISLEAPLPAAMTGRMDAVLHSLYLLFNEGYNSSHPNQLIRHDLCEEAIRLCILLTRNAITDTADTRALLALFCFQASREDARISSDGSIVLLKDQDRSKWSSSLIDRGKYFLEQSAGGDHVSVYHIEAAIAGCHTRAKTFEETDWTLIAELYAILAGMKPGPIVSLNLAIATGYSKSPSSGLEALKQIEGLDDHYLYHAAMGDFYARSGNETEAKRCYDKASGLTASNAERNLLALKQSELSSISRQYVVYNGNHRRFARGKVAADGDKRNVSFSERGAE